ncbi:hypothetical protein KIN20_017223 [Parelaphostrongylus tenuis]|uniref:Uncharacterized protein n=1 Tax=Parelaphostrongylus tenuis TaxID=148309 RepID=A0AAD5N658_PARTN|nr:hypothetical protein KIN20_017223 [Parelaphostrongylus tenuis]
MDNLPQLIVLTTEGRSNRSACQHYNVEFLDVPSALSYMTTDDSSLLGSRLLRMYISPITAICLLSLLELVMGTFRQQSVAVKGIVNSRSVRQPGAFVQLYDEDIIMDSDDLLGSTTADELGVFCVSGYTTEVCAVLRDALRGAGCKGQIRIQSPQAKLEIEDECMVNPSGID